jgi:hypothetical protein
VRSSRTAAAVLATAVVLTACGDTGDGAANPTVAPPATGGPAPASDPVEPPPPAAERGLTPEEATLTFVRAVAEGRADDAFALLTEGSRRSVGGREGFEEVRTALAEGFGAFAGASPQLLRTELGDSSGVLTLAAPVVREGLSEFGTAVLPYREESGVTRLDPFDRAQGSAEFTAPPRDGTVAPGGRIEVLVPAGTDVLLAVDGVPLDVESEAADGDRQRITARALDDLQDDRLYVLLVAWVDAQGRIGADAVPFTKA